MLKVYNYMASGVLLTGFVALSNCFKFAVVTGSNGELIGLTNLLVIRFIILLWHGL